MSKEDKKPTIKVSDEDKGALDEIKAMYAAAGVNSKNGPTLVVGDSIITERGILTGPTTRTDQGTIISVNDLEKNQETGEYFFIEKDGSKFVTSEPPEAKTGEWRKDFDNPEGGLVMVAQDGQKYKSPTKSQGSPAPAPV